MRHLNFHILILVLLMLTVMSCKTESKQSSSIENESTKSYNPEEKSEKHEGNPSGTPLIKYELKNSEAVQVFKSDKAEHQDLLNDKAFIDNAIKILTQVATTDDTKVVQYIQLVTNARGRAVTLPVNSEVCDKWMLNMDISKFKDVAESEFKRIAVHEFGHALALNNSQFNIGEKDNPNNYVTSAEGVAKRDAYINQFYLKNWTDEMKKDWKEKGRDKVKNESFKEKYADAFLTDYATSNSVEDFAESFMFFVMEGKKREGNLVKDNKVNFFYDYPYFTEIRNKIRERIYE